MHRVFVTMLTVDSQTSSTITTCMRSALFLEQRYKCGLDFGIKFTCFAASILCRSLVAYQLVAETLAGLQCQAWYSGPIVNSRPITIRSATFTTCHLR